MLVKGRASELHDPDELRRVASLPLHYWTLGDKAHWIRIVADQITGRRIWSRTAPGEAGRPHPTERGGGSWPCPR